MNDAKKIIKKVELMRHNSQEHETYRNLPLAKECMLLLENLDDPEEGPLGKAYACNAILEQLSEYDTPRFCMEILQREKQWVEESEEKSDWLTPESIDSDILRLEDYIDTEGISMQDFCKKHGKHLLFDPVERTPQWEEIYLEVEKECFRRLKGTHRGMGFCFGYWAVKRAVLAKYGIEWKSPQFMNPRVMFD